MPHRLQAGHDACGAVDWDPADRSPGRNYHFLTSAVAPRPIAWVTSLDGAGVVNVAPFSWFQAVCADPPLVMISIGRRPDGRRKDTAENILAQGEFVINAVTGAQADVMVATSAGLPPGASEAEHVGLDLAPAHAVRPPRVAASPFHLECVLDRHLGLGDRAPVDLVFGRVVHVHADDEALDERGNIDNARVPLVARLGGIHYTVARDLFEIARPD